MCANGTNERIRVLLGYNWSPEAQQNLSITACAHSIAQFCLICSDGPTITIIHNESIIIDYAHGNLHILSFYHSIKRINFDMRPFFEMYLP